MSNIKLDRHGLPLNPFDDYVKPTLQQEEAFRRQSAALGVSHSVAEAILDGAAAIKRDGDFMKLAQRTLQEQAREISDAQLRRENEQQRLARREAHLAKLSPSQQMAALAKAAARADKKSAAKLGVQRRVKTMSQLLSGN